MPSSERCYLPGTKELLPVLYNELRRLAAWHLANERPGQSREVKRLSYSPDGRWLASSAVDGKISLWDAKRMREASAEIPLNNRYLSARWPVWTSHARILLLLKP